MSILGIRVLNKGMRAIAELDNISEAVHRRRYFEPGEWYARLPYFDGALEVISEGEYFLLGGEAWGACLLERVEIEDSEAPTITISGCTLSGLLRRRVVLPNMGDNFFRVVQQPAETIMHRLVLSQAIGPQDVRRAMEELGAGTDLGRGVTTSWRATFWDNLADVLTDIGEFAGLGYDVRLSLEEGGLIFTVIEGRDLTSSQSERPMVVFGTTLDNLGRVAYDNNTDTYRNAVYAISGDVEADDFMAHLAREEGAGGRGLREIAYNASSQADDAGQLRMVAEMRLKERGPRPTINANVLDTASFRYMEDWDLGEIVTVVHSKAQAVIHQRITEVARILTPQGSRTEIQFGTDHADPVRKLQRMRG